MSTNKTLSSSQMLNMASTVIQSHRNARVWVKLTVGTSEGKGPQRICNVSRLLSADEFPQILYLDHLTPAFINPREHRLRQ